MKSLIGVRKNRSFLQLNPPQFIAVGFLALIFIGTILLLLPISTYPGYRLSFIDALFEATSAVCVTGLVVVDTATTFTPFGEIVILTLIQVGGLGFMTFGIFVAILLGKQIGLKERLMIQESLNQFSLSGMVKIVKHIVLVTILIEGIGAILLAITWSGEMGWAKSLYYGVFHSISAFNNAGFDLMGGFSSLTGYVGNVPINLIISSLFIIGGLGYPVIFELSRRFNIRKLSLHTKLVIMTTLILNALSAILIFIFEYNNLGTLGQLSFGDKVLASYFHGVVPRTAGFNSLDMTQLMDDSVVLTMILMFIGGSSGSTAGGIKITTFVILILTVWTFITGKADMNIYNRRIPMELVFRALSVTVIAIFAIVIAIFLLNLTEDHISIESLAFETVSAFGTVGLSLGATPELSNFGKIVITTMMFIGRLGPLTIAFALTRRQPRTNIRYPEEKILIG